MESISERTHHLWETKEEERSQWKLNRLDGLTEVCQAIRRTVDVWLNKLIFNYKNTEGPTLHRILIIALWHNTYGI